MSEELKSFWMKSEEVINAKTVCNEKYIYSVNPSPQPVQTRIKNVFLIPGNFAKKYKSNWRFSMFKQKLILVCIYQAVAFQAILIIKTTVFFQMVNCTQEVLMWIGLTMKIRSQMLSRALLKPTLGSGFTLFIKGKVNHFRRKMLAMKINVVERN